MKKVIYTLLVVLTVHSQSRAQIGVPKMLIDLNPGASSSSPFNFTEFDGRLYFSAFKANSGRELWSTDGTEAGTLILEDINPSTANSNPSSRYEYKNELYFAADDGANGRELYKTDGTTVGTMLLKDLYPGSNSSNITNMIEYNGRLYFSGRTSLTNTQLCISDGTSSGTKSVGFMGNWRYPRYMTVYKTDLYFLSDHIFNGLELFKSQGSDVNTSPFDINPGIANGASPIKPIIFKDKLFFVANDGNTGYELWMTDGNTTLGPGNTELLKDINPGSQNSSPSQFYIFNDKLYF